MTISKTDGAKSSMASCSDLTRAIIVNLGRTEAELPAKEQISKETYKQGDRIRAYILDVRQFSRGPQIISSPERTPISCPPFLKTKSPRFPKGSSNHPGGQGTREQGQDRRGLQGRTWTPWAPAWDEREPGPGGVQELRGEKIDIVPWDSGPGQIYLQRPGAR
jgi:transcription termination/antitermination protein NusA